MSNMNIYYSITLSFFLLFLSTCSSVPDPSPSYVFGTLHVKVLTAVLSEDLDPGFGTTDPYIILKCEGQEFRTEHKQDTLRPVFDQEIVFNEFLHIPSTLNVIVMDRDKKNTDINDKTDGDFLRGSDDYLGESYITLGESLRDYKPHRKSAHIPDGQHVEFLIQYKPITSDTSSSSSSDDANNSELSGPVKKEAELMLKSANTYSKVAAKALQSVTGALGLSIQDLVKTAFGTGTCSLSFSVKRDAVVFRSELLKDNWLGKFWKFPVVFKLKQNTVVSVGLSMNVISRKQGLDLSFSIPIEIGEEKGKFSLLLKRVNYDFSIGAFNGFEYKKKAWSNVVPKAVITEGLKVVTTKYLKKFLPKRMKLPGYSILEDPDFIGSLNEVKALSTKSFSSSSSSPPDQSKFGLNDILDPSFDIWFPMFLPFDKNFKIPGEKDPYKVNIEHFSNGGVPYLYLRVKAVGLLKNLRLGEVVFELPVHVKSLAKTGVSRHFKAMTFKKVSIYPGGHIYFTYDLALEKMANAGAVLFKSLMLALQLANKGARNVPMDFLVDRTAINHKNIRITMVRETLNQKLKEIVAPAFKKFIVQYDKFIPIISLRHFFQL